MTLRTSRPAAAEEARVTQLEPRRGRVVRSLRSGHERRRGRHPAVEASSHRRRARPPLSPPTMSFLGQPVTGPLHVVPRPPPMARSPFWPSRSLSSATAAIDQSPVRRRPTRPPRSPRRRSGRPTSPSRCATTAGPRVPAQSLPSMPEAPDSERSLPHGARPARARLPTIRRRSTRPEIPHPGTQYRVHRRAAIAAASQSHGRGRYSSSLKP